MDLVFRALADESRRSLLDSLRETNGQTLNELCVGLNMTRQAVSKHLAILEEANLVATHKSGREKLHYLNPVPIAEIADRWIRKFERGPVDALIDLKKKLELPSSRSQKETAK
jgi:DNA-binding transcriptional ArsR family regulator